MNKFINLSPFPIDSITKIVFSYPTGSTCELQFYDPDYYDGHHAHIKITDTISGRWSKRDIITIGTIGEDRKLILQEYNMIKLKTYLKQHRVHSKFIYGCQKLIIEEL